MDDQIKLSRSYPRGSMALKKEVRFESETDLQSKLPNHHSLAVTLSKYFNPS